MKAFLVTATVTIRVVMPDNATTDEICEEAKAEILEAARDYYDDYVGLPEEDTNCPFNPLGRDFIYNGNKSNTLTQ